MPELLQGLIPTTSGGGPMIERSRGCLTAQGKFLHEFFVVRRRNVI